MTTGGVHHSWGTPSQKSEPPETSERFTPFRIKCKGLEVRNHESRERHGEFQRGIQGH